MKILLPLIFLILIDAASAAETIAPLSVETDLIGVALQPGVSKNYSIWVYNNMNERQEASLAIVGGIAEFVELYRDGVELSADDKFKVEPMSSDHVEVRAYVPSGTKLGTYTGYIIVRSEGNSQAIPIDLKVGEEKALVEVKVEAISKEIKTDNPVRFHISLYNLGFKGRLDLRLIHRIKEIETERIITQQEEEMAMETSLSLVRVFQPENINMDAGRYSVETEVRYNDRSASSEDVFEVVKPFWTKMKLVVLALALLTSAGIAGFMKSRRSS
jgi:hypothetical protein